jgi:hypothetical protein
LQGARGAAAHACSTGLSTGRRLHQEKVLHVDMGNAMLGKKCHVDMSQHEILKKTHVNF